MKAESHFVSVLPLAALGHWPALIGVCVPDTAWLLASIFNGFKKPDNLEEKWMPLYRLLHSVLVWIPLTYGAWYFAHPLGYGFVAGGWTHLLLDWPSHSDNKPLWPISFSFDGKGL